MIDLNRKHALLAGLSLIGMAILAGFTYGYVYQSLVTPDDASSTQTAIRNAKETFLAGNFAWIGILILDVFAAWMLHLLFKKVHPRISILTAALRITYSGFLGLAILHLFQALAFLDEPGTSLSMMSELSSFERLWSLGLIVFGGHLVGLGILSWRAAQIPNFLAGLLIFAGICYSGIHLAKSFLSSHLEQITSTEEILAIPMALSEIGLAWWLLWRGGRPNTIQSPKKP